MKHFLAVLLLISITAACQTTATQIAVTTPTSAPPTATQTPIPATLTPKDTSTPVPPTNTPAPIATLPPPAEYPVTLIPLTEPAAKRSAEFSGMAWYGDTLILLPQYPNYSTTSGDGILFALPKADILAFLDGSLSGPLNPVAIPLIAPKVRRSAHGFEGYESIAFKGNQVFMTIEGSPDSGMTGYLVTGTIEPDLSAINLDVDSLITIPAQTKIGNLSDETILVTPNSLVTFYEANGAVVNPAPVAHRFNFDATPIDTIPMQNIEYRITDATNLDADGRFWAINYFFPGDRKLKAAVDPIADTFGKGATHATREGVERLIEMQYSDKGVILLDTPPMQLQLIEEDLRNWEGLVRLNERGFLLTTDKYPTTLLGFIAFGGNE